VPYLRNPLDPIRHWITDRAVIARQTWDAHQPANHERSRTGWLFAAGCALLVLVAVAGVVAARPNHNTPSEPPATTTTAHTSGATPIGEPPAPKQPGQTPQQREAAAVAALPPAARDRVIRARQQAEHARAEARYARQQLRATAKDANKAHRQAEHYKRVAARAAVRERIVRAQAARTTTRARTVRAHTKPKHHGRRVVVRRVVPAHHDTPREHPQTPVAQTPAQEPAPQPADTPVETPAPEPAPTPVPPVLPVVDPAAPVEPAALLQPAPIPAATEPPPTTPAAAPVPPADPGQRLWDPAATLATNLGPVLDSPDVQRGNNPDSIQAVDITTLPYPVRGFQLTVTTDDRNVAGSTNDRSRAALISPTGITAPGKTLYFGYGLVATPDIARAGFLVDWYGEPAHGSGPFAIFGAPSSTGDPNQVQIRITRGTPGLDDNTNNPAYTGALHAKHPWWTNLTVGHTYSYVMELRYSDQWTGDPADPQNGTFRIWTSDNGASYQPSPTIDGNTGPTPVQTFNDTTTSGWYYKGAELYTDTTEPTTVTFLPPAIGTTFQAADPLNGQAGTPTL
jgi:hypothetical protein